MATITFYNNKAEPNRVDKTDYLENALEKTGEYVTPLNVVTPTIKVHFNNYFTYNYVFIPDLGNRYYFITEKRCEVNGVWEISLTVDPLMTYKSKIHGLQALVLRNEHDFNPDIVDSNLILGSDKLVYEYSPISTTGTPWLNIKNYSINDRRHFVLALNCERVNGINTRYGKAKLFTDADGMLHFVDNFTTTVTDSSVDIRDIIDEFYYLPMAPSVDDMVAINNITYHDNAITYITQKVEGYTYTINTSNTFFPRSFAPLKGGWIFNLPAYHSKISNNFLNREPYTTAQILFQPFGQISVDLSNLANFSKMKIEVEQDLMTGDSSLYYMGYNNDGTTGPRYLLSKTNLKVSLPTLTPDKPFLTSFINTFPSGYFAPIGETIRSVIEAIKVMLSGGKDIVGNLLGSSNNNIISNGSYGSWVMDDEPTLIMSTAYYTDPTPSITGSPLNEQRSLNSLTGYTVCKEVHLDDFNRALLPEIDSIEKSLKTGVHLP